MANAGSHHSALRRFRVGGNHSYAPRCSCATNRSVAFGESLADVPYGAVGPKLISAPQSSQTKFPSTASMSVSFGIDQNGIPFNIQIDKSSDKELDDEVIAMIREWRFEAALSGGVTVQSHVYLDLSVGDGPLARRRPSKKQ